ncbi:hypothetical protein MMC16_007928, partial [Acarospora aff. strigata]|nr:hypothetical protein [Acarospora aff. strigata]
MPPLKYLIRLLRSVLWQRPLQFEPPRGVDLSSSIALVTGGNGGIGLETVRGLATRGATVIIGSRNIQKAQDAVKELQQESGEYRATVGRRGNLKLHIIELDLADLESVRTFASQVQAFLNGKKLDML